MIIAKDARATAEQARQDSLTCVGKCIEKAAQKGCVHCTYGYFLDPDTLEKLSAVGYFVENRSSSSDDPLYEIHW